MATVSVIVPVYKVEKYIHRCVDSILAQTFDDFELILVDDGSPDCCGEICDEYAKKDNRIHVIHQKNAGLSVARNVGIDWTFANSESEWLFFVDSDDWIYYKTLESLMAGAVKTGCSVVISGFERTQGEMPYVDDNGLSAIERDTASYFREQTVNAVVAWGKIYRKESFRYIRYPVGKIHEDEFTTYKILFQFDTIAFINQPLYFYFQNEEGIMNTQKQKMCSYDVQEERMVFFERLGMKEMHEWQTREYFLKLYYLQAKLLSKNSKEEIIVQKRMRAGVRKYRKSLHKVFNFYEIFSLCLMGSKVRFFRNLVVQNDFEPIQKLLSKIKKKI